LTSDCIYLLHPTNRHYCTVLTRLPVYCTHTTATIASIPLKDRSTTTPSPLSTTYSTSTTAPPITVAPASNTVAQTARSSPACVRVVKQQAASRPTQTACCPALPCTAQAAQRATNPPRTRPSRRRSQPRPTSLVSPILAHQQPTFEQAYAGQPASAAKGSWLARVSHRASHIPARTAAGGGGGVAGGDLASTRNNSLPLRSAAPAAVSHERLPSLQKVTTAEYRPNPSSPHGSTSPIESDFTPTPIDASFGDRIDLPADRVAGGSGLQLQRTRSGTLRGEQSGSRMDRYARQVGDHTYDSDADADDEFERSFVASPTVPAHFADGESDLPSEDEDDRDSIGGQDTPTTQGWMERGEGRSPTGNIMQWTEDQVADYVAALSPALKHYGRTFAEEGINGEALIALHHDELRELGVSAVGHRLTILKAVYEQKRRSGITIEEDDYVPLCRLFLCCEMAEVSH
jgi:hypothetical protein